MGKRNYPKMYENLVPAVLVVLGVLAVGLLILAVYVLTGVH